MLNHRSLVPRPSLLSFCMFIAVGVGLGTWLNSLCLVSRILMNKNRVLTKLQSYCVHIIRIFHYVICVYPSLLRSRQQSGGEPNIQGKVPERYLIVLNDEFIRVKYVLLYGKKRTMYVEVESVSECVLT